jgi:hypothetical protein
MEQLYDDNYIKKLLTYFQQGNVPAQIIKDLMQDLWIVFNEHIISIMGITSAKSECFQK